MEGMCFLNRTEPNRKKNRSETREPKPGPSQNSSEKPKRPETKRGFTVYSRGPKQLPEDVPVSGEVGFRKPWP